MKQPKVGLLPLFLKLYDDTNPHYRDRMVAHMDTAVAMLRSAGVEVAVAEVCRIREEFERAGELFRAEDVDAVVTLHLAYSPSLESIDMLLALEVPIIVLDITPTYDLTRRMGHENCISPNHGIHGVQDMCSMLRRGGRPYYIEAGHILHGDVIARVAGLCRAAAAARAFREARVGAVGGAFPGMGDFAVPNDQLRERIGPQVVGLGPAEAEGYINSVTEADIDRELEWDARHFRVEAENSAAYRAATKTGLALRRWAEEKALTALTVNFLGLEGTGLLKMPFPELSKAMMRGLGYAGEGDTLTAAMVAALMAAYPETTFTEIFCPSWEDDVLLLSHMGEMNLGLCTYRPLLTDCGFDYNATGDTVAAYGALKGGAAVLVNLAPMGERFSLLLSPVEMLDIGLENGAYRTDMQGWMRPPMPLPDYLREYSMLGGTHHSALVYGGELRGLEAFGRMMGFDTHILD